MSINHEHFSCTNKIYAHEQSFGILINASVIFLYYIYIYILQETPNWLRILKCSQISRVDTYKRARSDRRELSRTVKNLGVARNDTIRMGKVSNGVRVFSCGYFLMAEVQ